MRAAVLLHTADEVRTEAIAALLEGFPVIRCRDLTELEHACRQHRVSAVLLVEEAAGADLGRIVAELEAIQPGLACILLARAVDQPMLRDALEAGCSDVVQLPAEGAHLRRTVDRATERFRLRQENIRLRTLLPLYTLGERFLAASSEQEIFDGLIEAVDRQAGVTQITVMLYHEADGCLHIAAGRGMDPELMASIRLHPGDNIAGWVFQRGKPVILNKEDQAASIFSPLLKNPDIVTAISFPMRLRGQIIGVLNISQRQTDERFSEADIEMLSIICSQAAVAIDNLRSIQRLAATTRTRTLFEQYVAPEVAELLMTQNSDLMCVGGVETVTVLFADIRNFTRLVQQVDLPMLRSFLNAFFSFFTEAVFQHRGTVDKFMGDAALAIFGAPVRLDRPGLAAARAAWSIGQAFQALRDRWGREHPSFAGVDLGIAVTGGPVFLGNIGSARRLDYTVIGNAVNIAQRLAAESSAGRIYLTEAVRGEIEPCFRVGALGEMRLRGVEQPVGAFFLEDEKE